MGLATPRQGGVRERDGDGPIQAFLAERRAPPGLARRRHRALASPDPGRVFNACLVFGTDGSRVARYDKIPPVRVRARTTSASTSRPRPARARAGGLRHAVRARGLSICYDLRFPSCIARSGRSTAARAVGVHAHHRPGALARAAGRARDREPVLRAGAGQGGRHASGRRTFGHSLLLDPWGERVAELADGEGVVAGPLDPSASRASGPCCRRCRTARYSGWMNAVLSPASFAASAAPAADERLAIARQALLAPHGIDDAMLLRSLGSIFEHKVDYADLYFQYTRSEGWSLDEGIVKSGSFSIDQGVGVRAVSGDKTAFAYSDEIGRGPLMSAARATRTIARAGAGRVKVASRMEPSAGRVLYGTDDPIASLDATAKVDLLHRVEKLARAKDPRVVQVMAGLAAEWDVVLVARSDGVIAADVRPLVRLSVTVIAESNGRREQGNGGGGGRFGFAYFTDDVIRRYVDDAVHAALVNLESRPAPAGVMTVVLGPGWPGVLLHEAIGHGLEGDFNRKGSSAFAGRLGERVAAKGVTGRRRRNRSRTGAARSTSTTRATPTSATC
jgi:predicted amidohydrolase